MKQSILIFLIFFCCTTLAEAQNLEVTAIQFGTDVQERNIVNADSVFSNSIERIYCFTHVEGADSATTITHVWYLGDERKARVELPVKGSDWRTWSSKRILESWTGQWSVDVLDANGEVLATKTFRVESAMANQ